MSRQVVTFFSTMFLKRGRYCLKVVRLTGSCTKCGWDTSSRNRVQTYRWWWVPSRWFTSWKFPRHCGCWCEAAKQRDLSTRASQSPHAQIGCKQEGFWSFLKYFCAWYHIDSCDMKMKESILQRKMLWCVCQKCGNCPSLCPCCSERAQFQSCLKPL